MRGFAIAKPDNYRGRIYAAVEVGGVLISDDSSKTWNLAEGSDGNPDFTRELGNMIHPDAITAQMEGGVIMALSVAFYERVRFANGGVQTANYDEYPLLTMTEVPEIEVHIARSRHKIGGIGELGIPTVAPAVANAIANAVGVRLRELPFDGEQLKKA